MELSNSRYKFSNQVILTKTFFYPKLEGVSKVSVLNREKRVSIQRKKNLLNLGPC